MSISALRVDCIEPHQLTLETKGVAGRLGPSVSNHGPMVGRPHVSSKVLPALVEFDRCESSAEEIHHRQFECSLARMQRS